MMMTLRWEVVSRWACQNMTDRQEYEYYGSGSTLPVKWLILYHVYVDDHPKTTDPAMGWQTTGTTQSLGTKLWDLPNLWPQILRRYPIVRSPRWASVQIYRTLATVTNRDEVNCWVNCWWGWIKTYRNYMGVSENSVPLNPMVNDHYPY